MKTLTQKFLSVLLCVGSLSVPAWANYSIANFADEIPGIGLITDSIKFDGITIKDFRFIDDKSDEEKKYIFVKPEEKVKAKMHYNIDAKHLKTLNRHHLIIGLDGDGPQECVLHSLGLKDSEGDATVTLKAPKKEGAYSVRLCHSIGLTDERAKKAWKDGKGPSAKTIVGVVVVKK